MPNVRTVDEFYTAIDGQPVLTKDGIACTFKVTRRPHETRVELIPTAAGKKSKAYLATKRLLRDDWIADWTTDFEAVSEAAEKLGIHYIGR